MVFTAKDVCKKAITVEATMMMSDARDTMLKHNISRIIVEHNQKPVGMVTEKGISSYLYRENNDKSLDEIAVSKAMRSPLVSVTKDMDIRECAKIMLDNDISSLIVTNEEEEEEKEEDEREINIFTKSDLVKLYAGNYKGKFKTNEFMTKQVFTVYPSNSLHTAMKILMKNRVSRVIVTRGSIVVGIITAKDLMPITSFVEEDKLQLGKDMEVGSNLASIGHIMVARDVMKKPITVEATDDLANAAQIMTDKRISGLPVINTNGNNLEGVVTKTDIVKALMEPDL
jgi:CBS domain-containing protein